VDTDFSGDGHATVGAAGTLAEARASAIQNLNGEERILLGGWGRFSPIDSTGYNYVIARLCPDGTQDNGVNCSGDGFGQLGGIHMISFFDHLTGDHRTETITAITITQAESAACGDEYSGQVRVPLTVLRHQSRVERMAERRYDLRCCPRRREPTRYSNFRSPCERYEGMGEGRRLRPTTPKPMAE
jgi:hypothetical protein